MIRELKADGIEVTALRHSFEEDEGLLPERAELWLHFAWAGQGPGGRVDKDIQSYNLEMSMAALKRASRLGVRRFVFAGSQAEYGPGRKGQPRREQDTCRPISEYGKAKKLFSELGRAWVSSCNEEEDPISFLHLRIFSVYGPGDRKDSLISSAMEAFARDKELMLSECSQLWTYMYIKDAARAISFLSLKPFEAFDEYEAINVASEDTRPLRSYIEELRSLMGSSSRLGFGMRGSNAEGAADLCPDVSRLRELGFKPSYSFSEGIRELLLETGERAKACGI